MCFVCMGKDNISATGFGDPWDVGLHLLGNQLTTKHHWLLLKEKKKKKQRKNMMPVNISHVILSKSSTIESMFNLPIHQMLS